MDGKDEFDGDDVAPVPPHERTWRHPAEVSDASRQRHAVESAPPPVSRRVTALVAFVSLVASAVILTVTVPKGIHAGPETTDSTVVAGTPVKGRKNLPPHDGRVAVAISPHVLVTGGDGAAGDASSVDVTLPDGRTVTARVIERVEEHNVTLLRAEENVAPTVNNLSDEEFRYLATEGRLLLLLDDGTPASTSLGIATGDTARWWPLSLQSAADSTSTPAVARIVDQDGALVGVAVRHNHGTWAVKVSDLLAMVNDGGAGGG